MTPMRLAVSLAVAGVIGTALVFAGLWLVAPALALVCAGAPLVALGVIGLVRIDVSATRPRR